LSKSPHDNLARLQDRASVQEVKDLTSMPGLFLTEKPTPMQDRIGNEHRHLHLYAYRIFNNDVDADDDDDGGDDDDDAVVVADDAVVVDAADDDRPCNGIVHKPVEANNA
jgi:hypothetical protein